MEHVNWDRTEELLSVWLNRAEVAQHAHRKAGKHFARKHYILGGIIVSLSALVGTSLAARVETGEVMHWIITGISAAVFLLASLQTFLKYHERAERHESLRAGFSALCREIEEKLKLGRQGHERPSEVVPRIRASYNRLSATHTPVPERIWKKAERELEPESP